MRRIALVAVIASVLGLGCGCTNWQTKYKTCNAKLENLEALFEAAQQSEEVCREDKNQLAAQLAAAQGQMQALQNQPAAPVPAAFDSGFGGEDVQLDRQKGTITVTLESGVLFDAGQIKLKSEARSRLKRIAGTIKSKYGGKEISVVGHTDTDPLKATKDKYKDNWELSAERSLAVTRYLVSQGVRAEVLTAAGRGEYHPRQSKTKSRRVEIVVNMY